MLEEVTIGSNDNPDGGSPNPITTAFRLRDRIYRAGMQKVPRFRVVRAKEEDEEDEYVIDLFFKIVVAPADMRQSDHFSHCFRPGVQDSPDDEGGERESPSELVVPSTGVKVKIDALDNSHTLDVRDLLSNETFRLQAAEGIILREIYPDPRINPSNPMAELVIEARGCPYHLGGRDWPRHWYHIAIVHNAEVDGLFSGAAHDIRISQTPDRILTFSVDDDDDVLPPADEEIGDQDAPLFVDHDTEFDRFWDAVQPYYKNCTEFALGPESPSEITRHDSKEAFDSKIDDYGDLDLVAIANNYTSGKLLKRAKQAKNRVHKFNWRALAYIVEHDLWRGN